MSHTIAVCGTAGAGKSTLVGALEKALPDATAIHIDSYQRISEQPVRKIVEWMERGADFDEFSIPLIGEHLAQLRRGVAVRDPRSGRELRPAKYILFETHFGRAHRDSGRHVDLLLWIDTPLDVALARNVLDLIAPLIERHKLDVPWENIAALQRYLAGYLADVRRLRLAQRELICAEADVILDGAAPFEELLARARAAILERFP